MNLLSSWIGFASCCCCQYHSTIYWYACIYCMRTLSYLNQCCLLFCTYWFPSLPETVCSSSSSSCRVLFFKWVDSLFNVSYFVCFYLSIGSTRWSLCLFLNNSRRKQKFQSIISPDWNFERMGIGGLGKEFSAIFRRAFASRVFPQELIQELG